MVLLHTQRFSLADIPALVRVHRACVRTVNARVYSRPSIRVWLGQISARNIRKQLKTSKWIVLKRGRTTIGFAQYSFVKKTLYQINIAPRYMSKGYGRMLYEYVEKDFQKHRAKSITLNATLNAVGFYKTLGFKRIKAITFPLGAFGIKMILMQKRLRIL